MKWNGLSTQRFVISVIVALTLLLTLQCFFEDSYAAPLADPDPASATPNNQLFLPLVSFGQSTESTALSYAATLTAAIAQCQHTTANYACLANGTAEGFAQTGDTRTLSQPFTLTVHSATVAPTDWSVVLIRLQAPGDETITQTLDLLAVGNVTISALQPFTTTEVAPGVPVVRFVSQAVQTGALAAPSGLIIQNSTHEELLNIEVNGAGITLGSTAFLQAQAGATMSVNMRNGSALVQAADAESAVVAGEQVTVPLDAQGVVNGAPSVPETLDDELLVPLAPSKEDTYNELSAKLFQSLLQCRAAHNPQRVYRSFYFIRQLNTPRMRSLMSQAVWDGLQANFTKCARFEVIFDSTINGNTTATWVDQVHSDGTFIQFDVEGKLVSSASSLLQHLNVEMSLPLCTLQTVVANDGAFTVRSAALQLYYNTFKIAMEAFPYMDVVTGAFSCPAPAPPLTFHLEWNTFFILLHPELWQPEPIYILGNEQWKYTGRQIFAEAIFADRSAPFANGTIHSTSYFILRHAPVIN
ncbi:MAG: hypothetical protein R3C14_01195 [Caldilineaceae bacterium]